MTEKSFEEIFTTFEEISTENYQSTGQQNMLRKKSI